MKKEGGDNVRNTVSCWYVKYIPQGTDGAVLISESLASVDVVLPC